MYNKQKRHVLEAKWQNFFCKVKENSKTFIQSFMDKGKEIMYIF